MSVPVWDFEPPQFLLEHHSLRRKPLAIFPLGGVVWTCRLGVVVGGGGGWLIGKGRSLTEDEVFDVSLKFLSQ